MKIFIVIPAFNEEKTIEKVLSKLLINYDNIVVVDDASGDDTLRIIKKLDVIVLSHLINRGQGASLKTGITYAVKNGADAIVTFDSDGQHNSIDIENLLLPLKNKEVEVVLGSRFIKKNLTKNMPGLRRLILKFAVIFTKFTSGLDITDTHNGLRAFSSKAAKLIRIRQDRMSHASEILDEINRNKLSYKEVPVNIEYTEYSKSKAGENQSTFSFIRILFKYFIGKLMR